MKILIKGVKTMNNNLKSLIIPEEMKKNIDSILEEQLFNANRYYAESNSNILNLMNIELKKDSISFLSELKNRWKWHNSFYEDLLEPAFLELLEHDEKNLSPNQICDLIKVYTTCCLVDEATLVMSGAIKKHLNNEMKNISLECEDVSKEDALFMLLTPPIDTFFSQYQIEHLTYIYLLKTNIEKAEIYKKYLKKQYHANDEIIFKNRFERKFSSKMDCSSDELLRTINSYKINDEYKIKHFYFTLGHPERKAFRDIIVYDNVDEKFISSQLIGISGFLIRKKILEYLNESKIIVNDGYIYEFSNDKIINGLEKLMNERKKNMVKEINPYKQKGMTCAIACMLMILEYYKIIPKANYQYEKKYFKLYHSYYLEGTPFSALAWHFAKNNLETEIVHSEKQIFNNDQGVLSKEIFNNSLCEYNNFLLRASEKGAKIDNGRNIDCKYLKSKLEEDKLIILAGNCGAGLHAILLCGYDQNNFVVCDPLYKQKQKRTFEEIEKFMDTPFGKWCVIVNSKKTEKHNLMNNLEKFQYEAFEKLNCNNYKEKDKTIQIKKTR